MANNFLGQSGNAGMFLGADGQTYQTAMPSLDPAFAAQMTGAPPPVMTPMPPPIMTPMPAVQEPIHFINNGPDIALPPAAMPTLALAQEPGAEGLSQAKPTSLISGQKSAGQSVPEQMLGSQMNAFKTIDKAYGLEGAGIQAEAKAAADLSKKSADVFARQAEMQAASDAAHKAEMDRIQTNISEQTKSLQDRTDQFMKESSINPNRYWEDKSTGSKIMGAIAIALGGIGGALQHTGGNVALSIIDKAIDRDIDAQRAQIDKAKTGIQMQQNMLGQLTQEFGSKEMAYTAAKKMAYDQAELQVKQLAARSQDPTVQAKAMQMQGQLMQKKAPLEMQMQQMIYQRALMSGGGTGANPTVAISMIADPEMKKEALKELPEFQKHEANKDSMMKALDDMQKHAVGAKFFPYGDAAKKYDAAKAIVKSNTTELYGGKSETEFEDIEKGFTSGIFTNPETLKYMKETLSQKADAQKAFPVLSGMGIAHKPASQFSFQKGK